jgi:hypothetical protein
MFPNWDCVPSTGDPEGKNQREAGPNPLDPSVGATPACYPQGGIPYKNEAGTRNFPHISGNVYTRDD